MKTTYSILKHSAFVAMGVAALGITACEDEPDKYEVAGGSPEVQYVCSAANKDSLLTGAFTNERVILVGNNLRSITKMYFNDREAILNSSLITDHTLFVSVPKELPGTADDKIYMINSSGDTTKYDFQVLIAGPVLTNMDCEIVQPGEMAYVNGANFLSYDNAPLTITMPDGQVITDVELEGTTRVGFMVPEGCTAQGPITLKTKYGTAKSSKFFFNDHRGILFDFEEGHRTNHGWHNRVMATEGGIEGQYMQMGDGTSTLEDASWNDGQFAFEFWPGSWDIPEDLTSELNGTLDNFVDFSNWEKMALKFEMNIPKENPWTACSMQLIFSNTEHVTLQTANNTWFRIPSEGGKGIGRGLYRPWVSNGGSFDTDGKWITVTVPFADFTYNANGAPAEVPISTDDFKGFTMFVFQGGVSGAECAPIIKVDNIRAVPYK